MLFKQALKVMGQLDAPPVAPDLAGMSAPSIPLSEVSQHNPPAFVWDEKDEGRCLPLCLEMISKELFGTAPQAYLLDMACDYSRNRISLMSSAAVYLSLSFPGTRFYSQVDHSEFLSGKDNYLRQVLEPEWYEKVRPQLTDTLERETLSAAQLVKAGIDIVVPNDFTKRLELVNRALKCDEFILASVDFNKLYGFGNGVHVVLIYQARGDVSGPEAARSNTYQLNDPAFENGAGIEHPQYKVIEAMRWHWVSVPKTPAL